MYYLLIDVTIIMPVKKKIILKFFTHANPSYFFNYFEKNIDIN